MTQENQTAALPLAGVRVLDFTRVVAGPFCTGMMADLGAEIMKVEPPSGDDQRFMGAVVGSVSANFEFINRNKKSIKLDLKNEEALALVKGLVEQADVVVENFRPGVTKRLGIDYASLKAINPKIIYCSISGFGQEGSMAKLPSYDVIAQAMSGFMSVTGEEGRAPVFAGDSIGDTVSGVYAAWAISTALFQRERTQQGQHLDIAMFDSLLSLLPTAVTQYQVTGVAPKRTGNRHPLSAPFGSYQAKDGYIIIAVANQILFTRLCETMGMPEILDDPRFASDSIRCENEAALRALIEGWASTYPVEEAVQLLSQAGVPASPVLDVEQALDNVQVSERQLFTQIDHPELGSFKLPEQPVKFGDVARGQQKQAPTLGADGEALLKDVLGWSDEKIRDLKARNII
ncbi:CaiB/BaiF CoA transferase family protein [Terasakiella pusilla]|uniref:CaiB/BaiF CoA transferase family protein n=1 Tax=Terasakiella pusilla TaxID=64973 RepID=UPI003AA8EA8A